MKRRSYSTTIVSALCIISFFAGRFLQLPGMPDAGKGIHVHRQTIDRKTLLEIDEPADQSAVAARRSLPTQDDDAIRRKQESLFSEGGFTSFEELVHASGMLLDRPPQQPGSSGHQFYTVQPMQLLSWYPRAYLWPKFMDVDKCNHIIDIAEKRLEPSGLALKKGDTAESTREIRTSQGTFMGRDDDPEGVLAWIEDKIAVLTGIPAGHGEAFNILRYELGQHYDSHYDVFMETDYGKQYSNRVATVLVYLSDVEDGGETQFLFEGENGMDRISTVDYKLCNTGIGVKPRAGDALLFWSMHPDRTVDKHSLHGGCPVIKGTKWTMTKWIRDKCAGTGGTCLSNSNGKNGAAT